jgi:CelD/BcsL family acetyltransferase involved in cellulose biosynthesis
MTPGIEILPVPSFAELGAAWRALEATADPAFFQSWSWIGCLAEERYPDPVLLRATAGGRTLGLALFNRQRGRLCLAESGDPARDAPFIEHNAPLLDRAAPAGLATAMLRAAWGAAGTHRLVLSGIAPDLALAAGGVPVRAQWREVPYADLDAIRAAGGDYLATLSGNTRYQLRRSARHYAALGAVRLERAATEAEALAWFDALIVLHGASWRARGKPGAFADPFMVRFHRALIRQALPRGEIDLLRLRAGEQPVGYLYNFRLGGRVLAYQSGFELSHAGLHGKPGLTCHHFAVERALAAGDAIYDFLAGADRYKRSLTNAAARQLWIELVPRWSPLGVVARLRHRWHGRATECDPPPVGDGKRIPEPAS